MKEVASTLKPVKLVISKQDTVVQQLQRVGMQEKEKNRAAMKSLVCCTHFLTRHHIAHSINFTQLVYLVVSCGARELQVFLEKGFKKHPFLVSWQMSALHSGGIVSFLSLGGRWHSC